MHLLLIHGLGQTALDWNKTMEGLDKHNQVVCPELCEMLKDKEVNYAIDYPAKVNSMVLIGTQYTMPKRLLAF